MRLVWWLIPAWLELEACLAKNRVEADAASTAEDFPA